MLHGLSAQLTALLAPAFAERLTLVLNHVLASEAVATDRLRPHAGRCLVLQLEGWPALLPAPPRLAWAVTPAGLLEWRPGTGAADLPPETTPGAPQDAATDLRLRVDARNPAALLARAMAGDMPAVQVEGDAQLAGDINWLLQNLRWDVAADLERLFGPVVAQQLHQLGRGLGAALRAALRLATAAGERLRPS